MRTRWADAAITPHDGGFNDSPNPRLAHGRGARDGVARAHRLWRQQRQRPAGRAPAPSAVVQRAAPAAKGDGTLTIGTLLPQTGDLAFLGPPEFAGVQTAVDDINAAGGVIGKHVVQVKADSGDGTPDIAGAQTDKLLDANADVDRRCRVVLGVAERHRQDHRRRCRAVLAGEHLAGARRR